MAKRALAEPALLYTIVMVRVCAVDSRIFKRNHCSTAVAGIPLAGCSTCAAETEAYKHPVEIRHSHACLTNTHASRRDLASRGHFFVTGPQQGYRHEPTSTTPNSPDPFASFADDAILLMMCCQQRERERERE